MSKKKALLKTYGSNFDIIVVSTSATYSFTTGGASSTTWIADWGTGSTSAVGDNPVFDLSSSGGADVNITANVVLSNVSFLNDTALVKVNSIDANLDTDINRIFANCSNLTEIVYISAEICTNFDRLAAVTGLTSFPLVDLSSGTNFESAFELTPLTSFPAIDMPLGTNFIETWDGCNLSTFPLIDMSSALNLQQTWYNNSLTSFPAIDLPLATNFTDTWRNNNLTSFPLIDMSSAVNLSRTWNGNNLTTFPAIDLPNATNFTFTWGGATNQIDQTGVENILASLVANGRSSLITTIGSDGSALTVAAQADYDTLTITRGWTVTIL
jgi:hypothetical protein